jgi:hypothetical protein
MNRSVEDLIRISVAGGGFTLDGREFTVEQLVKIISAGHGSGSRIHVQNVGSKSTIELVRIAAANPGGVTLDLMNG